MNKELTWIHRSKAEEIHKSISADDGNLFVYLIEGEGGIGKTYLARDLGVRRGSSSGYEPAQSGRIIWSGILDLYDPDTNSNPSIEHRLLQVFPEELFSDYITERSVYDSFFKGGITGPGLEEQRHKVEQAFARGLQNITSLYRPVLVFDTVERLERAADPAQQEFGFFEDTASVTGWLQYQISQLQQGVVLLLGRRADRFRQSLQNAIENVNQGRKGQGPIQFVHIKLDKLDEEEQLAFFANRQEHYPDLKSFLDQELIDLLLRQAGGNPLLLDIALQSLLETAEPRKVKEVLKAAGGLKQVQRALIGAYMTDFTNSKRQMLLYYLALCRNGLFKDLLTHFEPSQAEELTSELVKMEELPFLKVREVSGKRTYFLHDAMYTSCDEILLRPGQVAKDTQKIVDWYDRQIKAETDPTQKADLLVESLFYRMRVDPKKGYEWYLRHADQAIRSVQTSLDMRLGDAMGIFLVSASPEEAEPGQSLSSPVDRSNVQTLLPDLFDNFYLDSIILWLKRYSMRGQHERILQVGKKMQDILKAAYVRHRDHYRWVYAEFLLWYGQIEMYGFEIDKALQTYEQVIQLVQEVYPDENIDTANLDEFTTWRLSLVLGRTYNNIGYTYLVYRGQYRRSIREFQKAIRLFRNIPDLEEELANSNDNMGRAYANLGLEFQAIQLIQNGLDIRKDLGLPYREALSRNTLANARIRFGQYDLAHHSAEEALRQFRIVNSDRGIGVGLLTQGMVYRNMAETWREQELPLETAIDNTRKAEADLREAIRIFQTSVQEPIREVQIRNELACCYRTRYRLLSFAGGSEVSQRLAFDQAQSAFQSAISLAKKNNYFIEELDSIQDLAVLLFRARQFDQASALLDQIDQRIPNEYKIKTGIGLAKLPDEDIVNAHYKLMGQVEMLRGAIMYERGKLAAVQQEAQAGQPTPEAWLETARLYLFAMTYYDRYSGEAFAHQQTYARMHLRFKSCPDKLVREITDSYLPSVVQEYCLPVELVRGSLRDVFGLFD